MQKTIFVLLCVALPILSSAQNMVLNPGFEENRGDSYYNLCSFAVANGPFSGWVNDWSTFNYLTPDLWKPETDCDFLPQAHSGKYMAGLITYFPGQDNGQGQDYHEMIQGTLTNRLQPGKKYRLDIWVHEDSMAIIRHIHQVFTSGAKAVPVRAGNLGILFMMKPQSPDINFQRTVREQALKPQVNFTEVMATRGRWIKLSGAFVPNQPFLHFIIGNFFYDAHTPTDLPAEVHQKIDRQSAGRGTVYEKPKRAAYLYVDDVSVTLEPNVETEEKITTALSRDKKFTLSAALLFDSGSAELRPEAASELAGLTAFLEKYPQSRLGIAGHTDDVGTEAYNLDLSGRRAKAVVDHLIGQGVKPERLDWKGIGEKQPVADNASESGRRQNRRVECLLLD